MVRRRLQGRCCQSSALLLPVAIQLLWCCCHGVLVEDGHSFLDALDRFAPNLEAAGYLRVTVSDVDRLAPAVVSVNTTLSQMPGQIGLLNARWAARQLAVDISGGVELEIVNLSIAMALGPASNISKPAATSTSYRFLPCFQLQPRSVLRLRDLSLYWDPAQSSQV